MSIVNKPGSEGPALGEREVEIMRALWVAGSGTVAEVRRKLAAELAYTTVLTILRNLENKGYVAHEEEGRVHRYSPLLGRKEATKAAICRVVDSFFEGSPEQLVRHLAQNHMIGRKELKRIRRELGKGKVKTDLGSRKAAKPRRPRPDKPVNAVESETVKGDSGGVELSSESSDHKLVSPVVLDSQNSGEAVAAPAVDNSIEHF